MVSELNLQIFCCCCCFLQNCYLSKTSGTSFQFLSFWSCAAQSSGGAFFFISFKVLFYTLEGEGGNIMQIVKLRRLK